MTIRAIIMGLLGVCVICGFGFFNDFVLRQTFMVGTYMPIPVYGGLLLFLLILNPVLRRISNRLCLSAGELGVVFGLMLFACFIPGRGLMHHATNAMMLPHHYLKTQTTWQETGVVDMVPAKMLADVSGDEDRALGGFVQGGGFGMRHISISDIPWSAWTRCLVFWGTMLLTMVLALTGLALVVNRQWCSHEQIPYPIVKVAQSFLPEEGRAVGGVFSNRLFWIGAGVVFLIHINNYAAAWWPNFMIRIPLRLDFNPLTSLLGNLAWSWWMIDRPRILFTVIGFAYFLATEVSLSMGLAPHLFALFQGICLSYGLAIGAGFFDFNNIERTMYGGAYLGIGVVMLYTGRRYYWSVLRRSLFMKSRDKPEASAVWGARLLMAASLLFVAQLSGIGIDWQLGALYTFFFLLMSLVLSRVVAETGAFFIHCWFYPCALLMSILGAPAFDPGTVAVLVMVTVVLTVDSREIFMPFAVHALALFDRTGTRLGRAATWGVAAVVLGLLVAVPVTLYLQYDHGAMSVGDGWTLSIVRSPFDSAAKLHRFQEAQAVDGLTEAIAPRGWQRFAHMRPHTGGMIAFCITFLLVLLFTFCRMRFARFPLHPVMFVVLGSYQSRYLGFSFLIGWLIKRSVVKYGSAGVYARLKPLMIGLIAGEMAAGAFTMIVGALYYFITDLPPVHYSIMGA